MPIDDSTARVDYRPIPGASDYRVGSDGSAWSRLHLGFLARGTARDSGEWRRLKPTIHKRGHRFVGITYDDGTRRTRYLHHLILEAFVGPCPPGMERRHLDGDPADNRPDNLAWGARLENVRDQQRHGVRVRGERVHGAKLTEDDVRAIRRLHAEGKGYSELGRMFGVYHHTVRMLVLRETWKHVV